MGEAVSPENGKKENNSRVGREGGGIDGKPGGARRRRDTARHGATRRDTRATRGPRCHCRASAALCHFHPISNTYKSDANTAPLDACTGLLHIGNIFKEFKCQDAVSNVAIVMKRVPPHGARPAPHVALNPAISAAQAGAATVPKGRPALEAETPPPRRRD
ncbi:unnamed protein product [Chrysodeixis includens]|uniref:Uncharacterized protein n=1 Tax=Chrysodeixis includens TaxID=689277 RepID=A0A9N8KQ71_CHRIL|nr:unnamed protein product [Chrysodeixis includens]